MLFSYLTFNSFKSMNEIQTIQHASNKLIVKEATNDPESLALVPYFNKGIIRLGEINSEVDSLEILQEKDLTGVKTDKDKTVFSLADYVIELTGAVHSHAYLTGNATLMSRVDYKSSVIKHLATPELLKVAGVVLVEAQNLTAEELMQAGIGPEDLSSVQNLIAELKEVNTGPKEAIIDRAGVTEKLGVLFAESQGIVKNTLDKLAPQYKRKAPEFYRRYKASRGTRYKGKSSPKSETVTQQEASAK
jgi:hypothetical protein